MTEYARRDIEGQGEEYIKHVSAMTREDLHDKSDIAAEFAHRDILIEHLQTKIGDLEEERGEANERNIKVTGQRDQLRSRLYSIRSAAQPFLNLSGIVRQAHIVKLENALRVGDKIEADTGGGCSVCGGLPAVNIEHDHEGTDLWLCGGCIGGRLDDQRALENPDQKTWEAMTEAFNRLHRNHHDRAITAIHEALIKTAYMRNHKPGGDDDQT